MQSKEKIREQFLQYRYSLSKEYLHKTSLKIKDNFFSLPEVFTASKFMAFCPFRNEIDTYLIINQLLAENKEVFIPYCLKETRELKISPVFDLESDLTEGSYGIKEPKLQIDSTIGELDIVLVPGLVFDLNGNRIGYGGGYYDRFISRLNEKTLTIGLILETMLVELLPVEKYDQQVNLIITEKRIIYPGGEQN